MATWQVEPLGPWTRPETRHRAPASRFTASWSDTMNLLTSEIEKLGLRGAIAVQVDVERGDIRLDGMLRANAKVRHPGVVVSFDSRFGPLSYATDAYTTWQANLRAIALSLQALRAVDRYGVTRSGEQYQGWRAIEAGQPHGFASADEALRWLEQQAGVEPNKVGWRALLRVVSAKLHPDRNGGDRAGWDRLDAARQVLEAGMP
jgi:hypothetical protein